MESLRISTTTVSNAKSKFTAPNRITAKRFISGTLIVTATDVDWSNTIAIKPLKTMTATRGMASTMKKAANPGCRKP